MSDDFLNIGDTDEILTPSYHGELCRHNGENPDYELACDECPHYLTCFPDWQYLEEKYGCSDEKGINSIKTSSEVPNTLLISSLSSVEPFGSVFT